MRSRLAGTWRYVTARVSALRVGGVSVELRVSGASGPGGDWEGGKKRRAILFLLSLEKVNLASAVLANGSLPEGLIGF